MKPTYLGVVAGRRRERNRQAGGVVDSQSWVVQEIGRVCEQLDQAEHCFDMASEQEMIDAAIYTMRACECRLSYLFGLVGKGKAPGGGAAGEKDRATSDTGMST